MVVNPAANSFSAEYPGEHPAYDGFDEYLRIEFPKRPEPITKVWRWHQK